MPYDPNGIFEAPDKSMKIWRYMDLSKFLNLLVTNSLYFSGADKFDDPYEGSSSKFNNTVHSGVYAGNEMAIDAIRYVSCCQKRLRSFFYINCWHLNEVESDAMWKLYLKSGEGIAIQSTVGRYIKSIENVSDKVIFTSVRYIDYETEWMPEGNLYYPYIHKRKSFEHEKEIRAIVDRMPQCTFDQVDNTKASPGIVIPVDVNKLIEKIYIAPTSPDWLKMNIESLLEKYGVSKDVHKSELDTEPFF